MNDDTEDRLDRALIDRARRGDRGAANQLCASHRPRLVRFCWRYLGDPDMAEDAAQVALARVLVEGRWPEGALRPWLCRVARNECLSRVRRREPGGNASEVRLSALPGGDTGPRTAAANQERDAATRRALARLPAALAEVLTLCYFEQMGRRDIAAVLGVSEATVKGRLTQARKEIGRCLAGSVEWP